MLVHCSRESGEDSSEKNFHAVGGPVSGCSMWMSDNSQASTSGAGQLPKRVTDCRVLNREEQTKGGGLGRVAFGRKSRSKVAQADGRR
eukprot:2603811-Amphidinium_carterae.1